MDVCNDGELQSANAFMYVLQTQKSHTTYVWNDGCEGYQNWKVNSVYMTKTTVMMRIWLSMLIQM